MSVPINLWDHFLVFSFCPAKGEIKRVFSYSESTGFWTGEAEILCIELATRTMGYPTLSAQKKDIEALAKDAFHQHLISGYGDSEYPDQYQITYKGKPRHLSLDQAQTFLQKILVLAQLDRQMRSLQ